MSSIRVCVFPVITSIEGSPAYVLGEPELVGFDGLPLGLEILRLGKFHVSFSLSLSVSVLCVCLCRVCVCVCAVCVYTGGGRMAPCPILWVSSLSLAKYPGIFCTGHKKAKGKRGAPQ